MTDYIDYEGLAQAASLSIVRETLRLVSKNGTPPGDHHFYITFRTRAPGVKLADHLVERFPEDITIVIQHQFWDLEIFDDRFEIILKFSGVPQHLSIPFNAVTRFVDPSVNYGLVFEDRKLSTLSGSAPIPSPVSETEGAEEVEEGDGTVVNLDAFRRK